MAEETRKWQQYINIKHHLADKQDSEIERGQVTKLPENEQYISSDKVLEGGNTGETAEQLILHQIFHGI